MTKEERLEWLKCIEKDIWVNSLESTFEDDSKSCAIHSIIEELEQEPFKPMVEIDLYSVIKQSYIEREVLDKIRAEIKALSPEPTAYDVVDGNPVKDAVWETLTDVLKIIDKYNAESEVDNRNVD